MKSGDKHIVFQYKESPIATAEQVLKSSHVRYGIQSGEPIKVL
jgi:hypothetical protein